MSIFSNNIVSDICDTEKVRSWIANEVIEYFNYLHSHINSDEYWKCVDMNNTYDVTRVIQNYLAHQWIASIHGGYLRNMGVAYTITNVKKNIWKNQFTINVRFAFDPDDCPGENVEIKNLKI